MAKDKSKGRKALDAAIKATKTVGFVAGFGAPLVASAKLGKKVVKKIKERRQKKKGTLI